MSVLHEIFVDNFLGLALIKSLDNDQVFYANSQYLDFVFEQNVKTDCLGPDHLNILINESATAMKECGFQFCKYVDNVFKETKLPLFAKEVLEKNKYITYRTLIRYNGEPAVMVLISICSKDKSASDINELQSMDVCQEMMQCCLGR
ncbi:hypothetical protein [Vibrio sp. N418]|uniref:hypothetical protein n=1 Tax=Vibrio sp. (strain N418) TaxID=701176 RepID=UPI00030168AD|nr:hypothetical protein [Vibrio sp. N418]